MKKCLFGLLAIMMVAIVSVGFASCSKDDDVIDDEVSLIGKWKYTIEDEDYYCQLTFSANGTVTMDDYEKGRHDYYSSSYTFTSKSDGESKLKMPNLPSRWQTVVVVSLTKSKLVLVDLPEKGENTFVKQ